VISVAAWGATSVYATDLDGDGDVDVLSASETDRKIAWYENLGGGSFALQEVIFAGVRFNSVYATDLDGDGDADVLSASDSHPNVAWYENLGGGSFSAQKVISTAADSARSVYATDLDGDGDADVLSASYRNDKIAWYENLLLDPIPGDTNSDGVVDGGDYTIWADNYLSQPVPAWLEGGWAFGNFTAGDRVDGADYTIWADNFTGGGGGGSAGALPAADGVDGEEDVLLGAPADPVGGHVWSVLSAAGPSVIVPRASLHALPGLSNAPAEASRQSAHPSAAWGGTSARTPAAEAQAALDDEIDLLAGADLSALGVSM
jgi:hypothetical protein